MGATGSSDKEPEKKDAAQPSSEKEKKLPKDARGHAAERRRNILSRGGSFYSMH